MEIVSIDWNGSHGQVSYHDKFPHGMNHSHLEHLSLSIFPQDANKDSLLMCCPFAYSHFKKEV